MAEEKEKTFPCPHAHRGCENKAVPANANTCPQCGNPVHLYCERCGQRYRVGTRGPNDACSNCGFRPAVDSLAYILAPPPEKKRCPTCRTEIPPGATRCPKCRRFLRPFTRHCTNKTCRKVVEPQTANKCPHCGTRFDVAVGKLRYVVCANCEKGDELDNLLIAYGVPLVFPTDQGDKVGLFSSVDDAARTWKELCEPDHSNLPLESVCAVLEENDEEAWKFASSKKAVTFLNSLGFRCTNTECGQTAWTLLPVLGAVRLVGPGAAKVGKTVGSAALGGASWLLPRGIKVIAGLFKKEKKKGGK